MRPPPDLSADQRKTYEVFQRIRMAWVTLVVILGVFVAGFAAFLFAIFSLPSDMVAKVILGGIDALVGTSMYFIIRYLFPGKK
jgi:hypothetical protein